MDLTADDIAGVVDVFGALTRAELGRACSELAFKRGEDVATDAFAEDVEDALTSYHLLSVADHDEDTDEALLVVGPAAFPSLPDGAGDLPHIMDVPARTLDEETVARAAEERFREDAVLAVQAGDEDRIASLLDVSYDLEAWGPVELGTARDRLDDA
ncbi:hypothetical protein EGH21_02300 [Halomicroarcula sp. F13]|uniref:Uncharacterized protein n=1 Tax=Haloarcula rubra TaxID=2487747 RepID=A0AAW4PMM0_9EURY|nr:hypothetical protein [Halomicroarcula rubra]MBX0321855.1 hypothetical protein [Halomicroarcula rubra]